MPDGSGIALLGEQERGIIGRSVNKGSNERDCIAEDHYSFLHQGEQTGKHEMFGLSQRQSKYLGPL